MSIKKGMVQNRRGRIEADSIRMTLGPSLLEDLSLVYGQRGFASG
ncbi:MAG: hypothetical protein ACFFFG_17040 [Candidatus Thorarchaeota archaeon]